MPTARLLDLSGKEIQPYKLITIKLNLAEWVDPKKIRDLIVQIERDTKSPTFTNSDSKTFIIQLHVKQFDVEYWRAMKNVEVFVTDMAKV